MKAIHQIGRAVWLLIAPVAFSIPAFAGSPDELFFQTTFHALGSNPVAFLSADLDGDGLRDVVVANRISADLSLLFGRRQPPYLEQALTIPVGGAPADVVARDLDGDGGHEIFALDATGGVVVPFRVLVSRDILLLPSLPVGPAPSSLQLEDLDGDGLEDLAVLSETMGELRIFRGQGDGTFVAATTITLGNRPTHVELVDLDRNGHLDVAVSLLDSGEARVFLSTGELSFGAGMGFPVPGGSIDVEAADLDGDGILDLTVTSRGLGRVTSLRGQGDGTFTTVTSVFAGHSLRAMVVEDVTLDGRLDVVVAAAEDDALVVLVGRGDGTFEEPMVLPVGDFPFDVVVADFSLNGIPDLACANLLDNTATVYRGAPGGGFLPVPEIIAIGRRPALLASTDVNFDGAPELLIAHFASDDLALLINEGQLRRVLAGNVNAGQGEVTDVLFVNDSAGDRRREVRVDLNVPVEIRMQPSPAGPSSAGFVLYALASAPGVNVISTLPGGIGEIAFSTPITGGELPRLIVLVNNLGHRRLLGESTLRNIPPAPALIVERRNGFGRPALVALQGLIRDFGTASNHPVSVTNGMTLYLGE